MTPINKNKALFITIDGSNGVGKTSITEKIGLILEQRGLASSVTSEPTKSRIGKLIREQEENLDRTAFACLVAADRYWHIHHEIYPALQSGQHVICARYVESSLVLQRLDGLDIDFIWSLNSQVPVPDLSIILDAETDTIEKRLHDRGQLSFYERKYSVKDEREYYLAAAIYLQNKGFNTCIVNNNEDIDIVATKIISMFDEINNLI